MIYWRFYAAINCTIIENFNDELNKGVASYDRYIYTEKWFGKLDISKWFVFQFKYRQWRNVKIRDWFNSANRWSKAHSG